MHAKNYYRKHKGLTKPLISRHISLVHKDGDIQKISNDKYIIFSNKIKNVLDKQISRDMRYHESRCFNKNDQF